MRASLDDAAPDERRRALVLQTMLTLFAEDAKERAACATMLEAHCDAVGNHYPDYVLKDRAPPVSSRRTDARRRRRESVDRPGRAVRRSASSARPRGRRTIASHAVETRTDTLNAALPLLEMVIQHAPGINRLPVAVSDPVPRDGRFGARSNSLAVPRNRAGPARPRRPLDARRSPLRRSGAPSRRSRRATSANSPTSSSARTRTTSASRCPSSCARTSSTAASSTPSSSTLTARPSRRPSAAPSRARPSASSGTTRRTSRTGPPSSASSSRTSWSTAPSRSSSSS